MGGPKVLNRARNITFLFQSFLKKKKIRKKLSLYPRAELELIVEGFD